MQIKEIDFHNYKANDVSLFNNLYNKTDVGYIVRNFFTQEDVGKLKQIYNSYTDSPFMPYEGFYSLPRPFNLIKNNTEKSYHLETSYINNELINKGIWSVFNEKILKLAGKTKIDYTNVNQNYCYSKSWASIRKLDAEKGYFDVHCGKLFHKWNIDFYDHFSKVVDINKHLSFFILLQKPEFECDIEVFDATWESIFDKEGADTLVHRNGTRQKLTDIPSVEIHLNVGDMFIFDEGNYWHLVRRFSGKTSRMSFGGFITKCKNEDKVIMWS